MVNGYSMDDEGRRASVQKIRDRKPTGAIGGIQFDGKKNMMALMERENAKLSAMEYLEGLYDNAVKKAVDRKKRKLSQVPKTKKK